MMACSIPIAGNETCCAESALELETGKADVDHSISDAMVFRRQSFAFLSLPIIFRTAFC